MTLLSIVQTVCRRKGLRVPTVVVDSDDTQIQQLYSLANQEGKELARFPWQALTRQQEFTTVSGEEQTGAIPDDLSYFLNNTTFNRTTRLTLIGPITPQLWQAIKAQPQLNRVYLAWRQRNNEYIVTPNATADQTVAFEYVTTEWAEAANGTPQDEFLADNDTTLLSEELFILGVSWRFLSAKGLDYAEDYRTYQTQLQMMQAVDGGTTQINITGSTTWGLWGFPNLPLGNFPG